MVACGGSSRSQNNAAIALAMETMKNRTMRKLGVSRREPFDKIEREALSPLPEAYWEYAEWKRARIGHADRPRATRQQILDAIPLIIA